jgi:hypothetical protein
MPHPLQTNREKIMSTNGFEFFEGTRTEAQTPQVTVRRSGQLVLTPPAVAMLGEDVSHVQVGYNTGSGIVGIRAAANGAKGRYRLRAQANGSSLVDGRRFLGHHGLKLDKAQTFPAEAVGDGIVGFTIPKSGTAAAVESDAPVTEPKAARTGKQKATATA